MALARGHSCRLQRLLEITSTLVFHCFYTPYIATAFMIDGIGSVSYRWTLHRETGRGTERLLVNLAKRFYYCKK
jgi:hypothetical protein